MEEGDFSGSSVRSEVSDGQNTTSTTKTRTTSEHQPKALVLRLLEVQNGEEAETDGEERQEEESEVSETHKSHEASASFRSRISNDPRKASDSLQSRKASDPPQSRKASDSLQPRKGSDSPESCKASDSLQSLRGNDPPQSLNQEDGKDGLFPNAMITTYPSLMARFLPRLQLASLRGRFSPDPAEASHLELGSPRYIFASLKELDPTCRFAATSLHFKESKRKLTP